MDSLDQQMILNADEYLKSNGIISDYHKNNMIIGCMCICNYAKSVTLDINQELKNVHVIFYISRLSKIFRSKSKLFNEVCQFLNNILIGYSVSIEFKIYEHKRARIN